MGKLNMFQITFNNIPGIFYAGQAVQGNCVIELTAEMSMRGVRLKFEGKAYVHWSERHSTGSGKNRRTVTRHYSASENYFNQEILLQGSWPQEGRDNISLPPGRHCFPFSFNLPPNLPSSFEGAHGHVRYSLKGTIDKPWKFDHTCKRPFTVISILDLNADANCQQPIQGHNEKMLCCLCCASGPITADFRLERRGFVPGEPISIFANIQNNSNRKMEKSYVDLKMITTFHATSKSRMNCQEVARIEEAPIEEGKSFSWEGQKFVIPPLPPSYLVGCRIIDIRYILQLNVDPTGPGFDLEVPLEIIIGTIPLRQVLQQYPPPQPPSFPPAAAGFGAPTADAMYPPTGGASAPPMEPVAPFMPPTNMPNLPPPSYGECVLGKVNVKDDDDNDYTQGNLDFAPAYTYYDWGHKPTSTTYSGGN